MGKRGTTGSLLGKTNETGASHTKHTDYIEVSVQFAQLTPEKINTHVRTYLNFIKSFYLKFTKSSLEIR